MLHAKSSGDSMYILSRATSPGLQVRWREDMGGGPPNAREARTGKLGNDLDNIF